MDEQERLHSSHYFGNGPSSFNQLLPPLILIHDLASKTPIFVYKTL